VTFHTSERVNRVLLWIQQAFAIDDKAPMSGIHLSVTSDSLHAGFVSVSDGAPLIIRMGPENGGTVCVRTDSMELAGDIVQDLARYLKIEQLDVLADFPAEMERFTTVLSRVEEYNSARLKMSAAIADSSNLVKTLVIKAEDARILNAMDSMGKYYSQLFDLNRELIGEYNKRANNHAELLAALKEVNHMIGLAARLRMGEAKQRVVAACRVAIKANNTKSLLQIIKVGHPA
jgi:Bardet-Biedl syndrome 2 protein